MADEDRKDATTEEAQTTETTGFDSIVDDSEADQAKPEVTEEAESTETEEEDTSEVVIDAISDEDYTKASDLGISRSQAEELGSDGLTRVMRKLTPPDSAQVSDAPEVGDAAQSVVGDGPTEIASGKRTGSDLDPELYDTELLKSMADGDERVMAEVNRRLGPIQDRLHKLTVEAELHQERESKAQFDRQIASLEGYDKEFGTTTPTRTQQANRQAVRTQMRVEQAGREIEGLPVLTEDQLLQRALSSEHPTKAKQQAREEIASTLTKRTAKMIARPTQTKGQPVTGSAKARRSVRAKLNEQGRSVDSNPVDDDELDVFNA